MILLFLHEWDKSHCGSLNNGFQRYPWHHPWNLCISPYTAEGLLRWGDYPGLPRWALIITSKKKAEENRLQKRWGDGGKRWGYRKMERSGRIWTGTKSGGKKIKETDYLLRLTRGTWPVNTLTLAQWNLFQTLVLQNCKRIDWWCYKPLNFWQFITVAIENGYSIILVQLVEVSMRAVWKTLVMRLTIFQVSTEALEK